MEELTVYCGNCGQVREFRPKLSEIAGLTAGEWRDMVCVECASIIATFSRGQVPMERDRKSSIHSETYSGIIDPFFVLLAINLILGIAIILKGMSIWN